MPNQRRNCSTITTDCLQGPKKHRTCRLTKRWCFRLLSRLRYLTTRLCMHWVFLKCLVYTYAASILHTESENLDNQIRACCPCLIVENCSECESTAEHGSSSSCSNVSAMAFVKYSCAIAGMVLWYVNSNSMVVFIVQRTICFRICHCARVRSNKYRCVHYTVSDLRHESIHSWNGSAEYSTWVE